ncbi:S-layer homology domain-containing protein [Phascolarctobacterium succinatutens]|uniref:S-layer homology domain-containing protein n=1 Tax=Phascolarctobacterium succinatutens TaxID=626940 RepID=UPI0023F42C14|nr:S-layer homology domain-containing protein [Phascolarctobacterium succinatutens]
MKKSLVLAMAMALGVTASAYAANPFSDVPAGHWAYDSINKLAAAGVIEGYGDTTFGGDKLMTRYEMAQIVAKAMAKGANVDKLAAEFADELDNLGVRVANLEKKADNVKVTGEMRYLYEDYKGEGNSFDHNLRSRIWVNGQVNDDWSYTGMLQNTQDLKDNAGNETTKFQRAYVEGKLGGLNVTAGRYNAFFANGNVYDTRADGVEVSYGSKIQLKGFAGKATDAGDDSDVSYGNYAGAELTGDFNKLGLTAGYVNFKDMGATTEEPETNRDNAIWYVGGSYDFDGNVAVSGMYLKGDMSKDDKDVTGIGSDGWTAGLTYKGAEASEAGSWGLFANYYDQGGMTYVAHTTDAETFAYDGFKGWGVGTNYTFAKNIVGTVAYYDTENKVKEDEKSHIVWADLTFTF